MMQSETGIHIGRYIPTRRGIRVRNNTRTLSISSDQQYMKGDDRGSWFVCLGKLKTRVRELNSDFLGVFYSNFSYNSCNLQSNC
jgi:hypothetical protein